MAFIQVTADINISADQVWDAVRDIGAIHTRLCPGFVVNTEMELDGAARLVTFATGTILRELIVDCSDARKRLAWAIKADGVIHHNGVMVITDLGQGLARAEWSADVLPQETAERFAGLMAQGIAIMKQHLEHTA
jgi:hypothetical protein